jgi:hypothetical protein
MTAMTAMRKDGTASIPDMIRVEGQVSKAMSTYQNIMARQHAQRAITGRSVLIAIAIAYADVDT